ncbi:glycosyltransferase family 9 protein [Winogradskyella schleiferi]|uniref:glycosyltransferase family 9 protein n=1 Tax=Winogradskyella schleiferi TaxID=2686078 RepID=UPI0015B88CD5|nr:glycosyltransferase family 9 protein [Winogradskyella schleiferi]
MSQNTLTQQTSILVYKSYGGMGDIFFTIPSLYMLKQKFSNVTYATQPRFVKLFKANLPGISVLDENEIDESDFDEVIELGNYPKFHNDLEKKPQITYHTHKKVKQHSIEHYKDGIVAKFPELIKTKEKYPYFPKTTSGELYYTVHPGAGFLLKAWPIDYYAKLMELIHDYFPQLKAKIIIGPNDPNPEAYFSNANLNYDLVTGGIDEVAKEISGAFFHIGNDAGITHLAAAFNIPILTIYGPTGPGSWGAFSETVELIWGKRGNCGQRCNYNVILACEDRVCLNKVSPKKMLFLLLRLFKRMGVEQTSTYLINPEFTASFEDNSIIFQSKENEYLIDINDKESFEFMKNSLSKTEIIIDKIPKQFRDIFQAMLELDLFEVIPNLRSLNK